jgi:phosphomevalonate kinase
MSPLPAIGVSAPGKVLLAGGYLVLDRAYTGLVFGLSARIHVVVQDAVDHEANEIVVQSPQFREAEWRYAYMHNMTGASPSVKVTQLQG